jgi:hypothetical protein
LCRPWRITRGCDDKGRNRPFQCRCGRRRRTGRPWPRTATLLRDDETTEGLFGKVFAVPDEPGGRKLVLDLGPVEYVASVVVGKLVVLNRKGRGRRHRPGTSCSYRRRKNERTNRKESLSEPEKHERPAAPEMSCRRSGPHLRWDRPEPVRAGGSVVTDQVCWGTARKGPTGHPSPYEPKSAQPTGPDALLGGVSTGTPPWSEPRGSPSPLL